MVKQDVLAKKVVLHKTAKIYVGGSFGHLKAGAQNQEE